MPATTYKLKSWFRTATMVGTAASIVLVFITPVSAQSPTLPQVEIIFEERYLSVKQDGATPRFASVRFTKGEAMYQAQEHPGKSLSEVVKGDKLVEATTIQTGVNGFVSLELSSAVLCNIQPNSRISLKRQGCNENDQTCVIQVTTEFVSKFSFGALLCSTADVNEPVFRIDRLEDSERPLIHLTRDEERAVK